MFSTNIFTYLEAKSYQCWNSLSTSSIYFLILLQHCMSFGIFYTCFAAFFQFCHRWFDMLKIVENNREKQNTLEWSWCPQVVAQRCSVNKALLKISLNSQENTCVRVCLLIKSQSLACKNTFKNTFFNRIPPVTATGYHTHPTRCSFRVSVPGSFLIILILKIVEKFNCFSYVEPRVLWSVFLPTLLFIS